MVEDFSVIISVCKPYSCILSSASSEAEEEADAQVAVVAMLKLIGDDVILVDVFLVYICRCSENEE